MLVLVSEKRYLRDQQEFFSYFPLKAFVLLWVVHAKGRSDHREGASSGLDRRGMGGSIDTRRKSGHNCKSFADERPSNFRGASFPIVGSFSAPNNSNTASFCQLPNSLEIKHLHWMPGVSKLSGIIAR